MPILLLTEAVGQEDALNYKEAPDWFKTKVRFEKAWKYADVEIGASRIL